MSIEISSNKRKITLIVLTIKDADNNFIDGNHDKTGLAFCDAGAIFERGDISAIVRLVTLFLRKHRAFLFYSANTGNF
jgi:hypothetical protein